MKFVVGQCLVPRDALKCHVKHGELFSAPIESIGKLIAVAAQVLYRNLVENALHTRALAGKIDSLRCLYAGRQSHRRSCVDRAMPSAPVPFADYVIHGRFIRMQNGVLRNVL